MKISVFSALALAFAINYTHGIELGRRQADPCQNACANVVNAIHNCPTNFVASCLCPVVTVSGPACSSCYQNVPAERTLANIVATIYTECVQLCLPECGNIFNALTNCPTSPAVSELNCLCPTVTPSAQACSSCYLNYVPDQSVAAFISTVLTNCMKFASIEATATLHTTPEATTTIVPEATTANAPGSSVAIPTMTNAETTPNTPGSSVATSTVTNAQTTPNGPGTSITVSFVTTAQIITTTATSKSGASGFVTKTFGFGSMFMVTFLALVAGFIYYFI